MEFGSIQFALGSFYTDCPHKRIIMKVYSDRNNIQVELIRLRKNIDFSAVGKFQVGQQFIKLGSFLYMTCRHRSVKSVRKKFLCQLTNNAQTYLWNSEFAIDG